MEAIKWTERKFLFGYDMRYVPVLLERLRCTAPRMEELFSSTDDIAASMRNNGQWSVKEHAGHLIDLERLHDGRMDDIVAGAAVLRAADMTNKATNDAGHNGRPLAEILTSFRETRERFLRRVEALDEIYFERKALHPRLQQTVTLPDMLYFGAEHDAHHLERIAWLLK